MARNQEKAQTMLARWLRFREEETKGPKERRPYLASLCNDLHKAEKWRGQIIRQISKNVSEIQNASLGEHRIRDLNDRINKLLREKKHWENRIRELGGHNYKSKTWGKGIHGMSIGAQGGYLYFGAARELPGVRELLETSKYKGKENEYDSEYWKTKDRKKYPTQTELLNKINPDYYGFGDDDDNELYWRENEKEKQVRKIAIEKWAIKHNQKPPPDLYQNDTMENILYPWKKRGNKVKHQRYTMNVKIPTQDEINQVLLQKRKELMKAKYLNKDSYESKMLARKIKFNQSIEKIEQNNKINNESQNNNSQNSESVVKDVKMTDKSKTNDNKNETSDENNTSSKSNENVNNNSKINDENDVKMKDNTSNNKSKTNV